MRSATLLLFFLHCGSMLCQSYRNEDGIIFEPPGIEESERYKYTYDNVSYKLHSSFTFDYYYLDEYGKKYKFLFRRDPGKPGNELELANYDSSGSNVIDKIRVDVDNYREAFSIKKDYPQTVLSYNFLNSFGETADTIFKKLKAKNPDLVFADEFAGVVDNWYNLWLHPPRTHTFKLLQLSPYPFVVLDDKKEEWSWELETGGAYLDIRWIPQRSENRVGIKYEYRRGPDEIIDSPIGRIKCKVVQGSGAFEVEGIRYQSSLKSYYYHSLGFVRLEYQNVNRSRMVLQLIDFKGD